MTLGTRPGCRRGTAPILVLCLYLVLASMLLGAVTVAASTRSAVERDYRRSQALALAEAGLAEALMREPAHGERPLGQGTYSWTGDAMQGSVTARGTVLSPTLGKVTRTLRARIIAAGGDYVPVSREEGP